MKSTVSGRKRLLIYAIGIFSLCLVIVAILQVLRIHNRKMLKFSVDDATEILMEIAVNDYDSIFESDRLSLFKRMHDEYDLDVTLFLFEKLGSFDLANFPDKYKDEFEQNSDWLKLGWHGIDDGNPQESGYSGDDLVQSYCNTTDAIIRFAGKKSLSKELRVHFWYTDGSDTIRYLAQKGISGLYYCDTDVIGYDFSGTEDAQIRSDSNGLLKKRYGFDLIRFQLTDIRLDNLEEESELITLLQERDSDNDIVVFTHAWMMNNSSQYIEAMCKWATDNDYKMNWN